jgi:hypothetical protein
VTVHASWYTGSMVEARCAHAQCFFAVDGAAVGPFRLFVFGTSNSAQQPPPFSGCRTQHSNLRLCDGMGTPQFQAHTYVCVYIPDHSDLTSVCIIGRGACHAVEDGDPAAVTEQDAWSRKVEDAVRCFGGDDEVDGAGDENYESEPDPLQSKGILCMRVSCCRCMSLVCLVSKFLVYTSLGNTRFENLGLCRAAKELRLSIDISHVAWMRDMGT